MGVEGLKQGRYKWLVGLKQGRYKWLVGLKQGRYKRLVRLSKLGIDGCNIRLHLQ